MRLAFLALTTALALGGCTDIVGSDDPEFNGTWTGVLQGVQIQITANENDDEEISGSGTLSEDAETFAFSLTGTHNHPNVSLTLDFGTVNVNFAGEFESDDTVEGRFSGAGFPDDLVTLNRQ